MRRIGVALVRTLIGASACTIVIIAAVALEVLGQLCFKRGTSSVDMAIGGQGVLSYWGAMLANAWVLADVVAYAVEIVVVLAALSPAPLSVVFPQQFPQHRQHIDSIASVR